MFPGDVNNLPPPGELNVCDLSAIITIKGWHPDSPEIFIITIFDSFAGSEASSFLEDQRVLATLKTVC